MRPHALGVKSTRPGSDRETRAQARLETHLTTRGRRPMNRVLWAILTSALPVAPVVTDHWPQFRGTQAGLAADNPSLPAIWAGQEPAIQQPVVVAVSPAQDQAPIGDRGRPVYAIRPGAAGDISREAD